jgi:hypothetical protein
LPINKKALQMQGFERRIGEVGLVFEAANTKAELLTVGVPEHI